MRIKNLISLLLIITFALNSCSTNENKEQQSSIKSEIRAKFKNKAKHGEDISIYVDFGISSAQPRFFVYDNKAKSVISESKCAHGCGGGSTIDKPVFSNKPGSECSSLGDYRLKSISKLNTINAPCIIIDGLSSTNSNAAARGIVIHEGPVLADDITIGIPFPVTKYISQGCFTISSKTFSLLCQLLQEKKSIYLYATYN